MYTMTTDVAEVRRRLSGATVVAFDFETAPDDMWRDDPKAALDPHKAHIVGVSFSVAEGQGFYVPIAHSTFYQNANMQDSILFLAKFASDRSIIKVAHNLAFESAFLYALEIIVMSPAYDTIAAAQMTLKTNTAFRNLSDSGLKKLAREKLGMEMTDFEEVTGGFAFDIMDPADPKTIQYACADADAALSLYHRLNQWFMQNIPKHRYIVEEVESPTAVYCGIMKYNGLLVDQERMAAVDSQCDKERERLRAEIAGIIGNVDIGANASTKALRDYLFNTLQLPVMKVTAKNREAADDEVFILLAEWCEENQPVLTPLFQKLQDYRRWGKLQSTYVAGYRKHINPATGRIHSDLTQLSTSTGRFAARNPNVQNFPRSDGDEAGIRNLFIASPGCVLLSLDFSQIELRVGAMYCRDEKMLEVYRTGGDIHGATTSVIYHIPLEEAMDKSAVHFKTRRTIAKNVNFGTFYGLFANGLHKTLHFKAGLKTTFAECEEIIASLKAGYPAIAKWQDEIKGDARANGYVTTWLGRRRYLPDIKSDNWGRKSFSARAAMNTPIQGTAADILKLALGRILEGLPSRPWLKPLLQIHDELIFEIPEDRLHEAVDFVKVCMEAKPFPDFEVPIVAEAAYGKRFGEMNEITT